MANNPLKFIDPTGMKIEPAGPEEEEAYNEYRSYVDKRAQGFHDKAEKKGWDEDKKLEKAKNHTWASIQMELDALDEDSKLFRINMGANNTDGDTGGNFTYNPGEKVFEVNLSQNGEFATMQKMAHELKHAYQYLNGELGFTYNEHTGKVQTLFADRNDEIAAFRRQNLFTSNPITNLDTFVGGQPKYKILPSQNLSVANLTEAQKAEWRNKIKWFKNIKLRGL